MSTEIKPGQVWVWSPGIDADESQFRIMKVDANRVRYEYLRESGPHIKGGFTRTPATIREQCRLVTDVEPAPSLPTQDGDDDGREAAPLNPALVKAGDTVTVHVVAEPEMPDYDVSGEVYRFLDGLAVGGHVLSNPDVTLTAHQPAPQPEPEYEPGTVAVVIQGGDPGAGVDDHEFRAALQTDGMWVGLSGEAATSAPVSVRPLAVIDPAAVDLDAIVSVVEEITTGADTQARSIYDVLHAAFTELGIEVAR